jgi:hypothetical protein
VSEDPNAARDSFPVTHELLDKLDSWVQLLAARLPLPERVAFDNGFRWEFRERTALVLLVAKAVRMASGIRAAMMLAEAGFVTESASLLRIVSDFATEAFAVAEGELRDKRTKAQQDFIKQFFERESANLDKSEGSRTHYVGREELMKAHVRFGNDAGMDGETTRALMRSLNSIVDGYVHGAYSTAMELYHGGRNEFMVRGHEGRAQRREHQIFVAAKLSEVLHVIGYIALLAGDVAMRGDIHRSLARLRESGEQDLSKERGLP